MSAPSAMNSPERGGVVPFARKLAGRRVLSSAPQRLVSPVLRPGRLTAAESAGLSGQRKYRCFAFDFPSED